MDTQLLRADAASIALAADLLRKGQLVGFPTETVYGLGANAFDEEAVRSVFAAKGRPADNPLIVHIWRQEQLASFCEVPEAAYPLMEAFWPGPLTILMPKKPCLPDVCTAGLDTVAVRMPVHPVARELLQAVDLPIAAPSANRSGKPSPTTAAYVYQDMQGRIPLILDGGACEVGLESTVLDICHGAPCILRPGGVTAEMIREVTGQVEVAESVLRPLRQGEIARSPGMRYRHYAPGGTVTLVEGDEAQTVPALRSLCQAAARDGQKACVLCFSEHLDALKDCNPHDLGSIHDPAVIAHRLFETLRSLDDDGYQTIYSEVIPPEGVGLAVMNRLGRAASFHSVRAEDVLRDSQRTGGPGHD